VLYAVGNSDDATLIAPTKALLADPSPLVRGAAVWALSQLTPAAAFAALAQATTETDPQVLEEWRRSETAWSS
jgi:epoxyqueuosine reductase